MIDEKELKMFGVMADNLNCDNWQMARDTIIPALIAEVRRLRRALAVERRVCETTTTIMLSFLKPNCVSEFYKLRDCYRAGVTAEIIDKEAGRE